MRVRIARDDLRRIRELTRTIKALEDEIGDLVARPLRTHASQKWLVLRT